MLILAFRSKSSLIPIAIKTMAIRITAISINLSVIMHLKVIIFLINNNNFMQIEFILPVRIAANDRQSVKHVGRVTIEITVITEN
jgi:hypothetical protein